MPTRTNAAEQAMAKLEEKFMRLLETDRKSEEFETLFREVDAALGRVVQKSAARVTRAS